MLKNSPRKKLCFQNLLLNSFLAVSKDSFLTTYKVSMSRKLFQIATSFDHLLVSYKRVAKVTVRSIHWHQIEPLSHDFQSHPL